MDQSTKYLLTLLHLQKLSRLKQGNNYPNVEWWAFKPLKEAAEERFGVVFETKESDKLFKIQSLITFFIPFWEKIENPEY